MSKKDNEHKLSTEIVEHAATHAVGHMVGGFAGGFFAGITHVGTLNENERLPNMMSREELDRLNKQAEKNRQLFSKK